MAVSWQARARATARLDFLLRFAPEHVHLLHKIDEDDVVSRADKAPPPVTPRADEDALA